MQRRRCSEVFDGVYPEQRRRVISKLRFGAKASLHSFSIIKNIEHLTEICKAFGIPEFLQPWLDRFFETQELELIRALNKSSLDADKTEIDLERAYKRGIIDYNEDGRITLADFHTRFEIWAMFEGWKDIPNEIQQRLNLWELDYYENRNRELIEGLKRGIPLSSEQKGSEYLLLHEAEALLEQAEHIYLWPCNCRAMMRRCSFPLYTCLRFDNERGLGREISCERAKELTQEANRQGLMQLGEVAILADGTMTGGLCNCCADCCFPHLLAERLDSQKIWPTSRYVARYSADRCISCGICIRRCPFQSFQWEQEDETQSNNKGRKILFNVEHCRGCGVCATACPAKAIEMILL